MPYFSFPLILDECFRLLGTRIVSCHAKDIDLRRDAATPQLNEVMPGRGIVDYRQYLTLLAKLPGEVPLMLEHLSTAEEYAAARRHIVDVQRALHIA